MRLVCPNCAAQYEVDDSVIPNAGRDVQCSSCGQMWFQPGKAAMRDAELEAAAAANAGPEPDSWDIAGAWEAEAAEEAPSAAQGIPSPEVPDPAEAANPAPLPPAPDSLVTDAAADATEDTPAPPPPASPPRVTAPSKDADATASSVAAMIAAFRAEQDETETETEEVEDVAAPPPLEPAPRPGTQPRRALDDSLLSILREEAEREARARRTEGSSLETQEELNLTPGEAAGAASAPAKTPTAPTAEVAPAREPAFGGAFAPELMPPDDAPDAERVAHYGTEDDIAEPSHAAAHASGRERLPDIEEINSTLRAASDRSLGRSSTLIFDEDKRERSGFRFGFSSVMVVALIAFIIYSFAPQIAEKLPAAGPTLEAYVVTVDEGRLWLDAQLQRAIDRMQASQNAQP